MDKPLQHYTLRQEVQAGRIIAIGEAPHGQRLVPITLSVLHGGVRNITVVLDFITFHKPQVGGYMVAHDGVFTYMGGQDFETAAKLSTGSDEVLLLETRLQSRGKEVADLKVRIGQLEEALRLTGLIDKTVAP
jgi:hypothetical protein